MDRDTQTDRQREEALVGGFHGRTKKGWKRQGKRERRREMMAKRGEWRRDKRKEIRERERINTNERRER